MVDNIDLDIENYRTEELLAIINLSDMPANKGKIKQKIIELNYKFNKKPKILNFFKLVEKKLIDEFDKFNKETWQEAYENDDSLASKVLENQYLKKEKEEKKTLILNNDRNVIGREQLPLDRMLRTKDTVQGNKNPISRDIIKRLVNFDSHFRQILDPSSCACTDENGNVDSNSICNSVDNIFEFNSQGELIIRNVTGNVSKRLYTATNYTINLNQPLINVVDLVLHSVQVPNSWYVFTSDYGTDKIKFSVTDTSNSSVYPGWNTLTIKLLNGNYTPVELEQALNFDGIIGSYTKVYLDNNPTPVDYNTVTGLYNIRFTYNHINNKFTIKNNDPSMNLIVTFYDPDLSIDACQSTLQGFGKVGDGGKQDYNLGWLMGFREKSIELGNVNSANPPNSQTSESPADTSGPRYFYITLDEFNNNRPNKDLISLVDNQTSSFKLPKYFNNQTMDPRYGIGKYQLGHEGEPGYECVDVAGPPADRKCAENDLNIDLVSNLTKKQKYTVEQLQLARSGRGINRYFSPNSTDLLAKIPIYFDQNGKPLSIAYTPFQNELTKRIYFGPVKLTKFKIRLLHPYGFEVNLNDTDWSFSILVSQLYQY